MGRLGNFGKALVRASERIDGWANILTGIGLSGRDKRYGATVCSEPMMTREECEALWEGSDMAARAVEVWPREMTREGWDVKIEGDAEASDAMRGQMEALGVHHIFKTALEWERAYGGAAILVGADDGSEDLEEPLNIDGIKSITWLTPMASYELHPIAYYSNPQAPKFGMPMVYQIHPDAPAITNIGKMYVKVHESRLIHFGGIVISRRQMRRNNGWGDPVWIRMKNVLRDFDQSWGAASILIQDFAQAVLKIKDLAELVATDQDDVVVKRTQMIDMQRSVARMVLLDAEEEFDRKQTPMTGLPDMLDRFAIRLAASLDMPVTLLMGQSPAGLNATGESDIRGFYDRVHAMQRNHLQPKLKRLVELLMVTQGSPTGGTVPKNWSICFKPLWQESAKDQAAGRLSVAQADAIYLDRGVVSAEEVAVSHFGGDGYSPDIEIDIDGRRALPTATMPTKGKPDASTDKGKEAKVPLRSPEPVNPDVSPTGATQTGPGASSGFEAGGTQGGPT